MSTFNKTWSKTLSTVCEISLINRCSTPISFESNFRQAVWSALMISSAFNTMMILVESGPSLSLMFIESNVIFRNCCILHVLSQLHILSQPIYTLNAWFLADVSTLSACLTQKWYSFGKLSLEYQNKNHPMSTDHSHLKAMNWEIYNLKMNDILSNLGEKSLVDVNIF